MRRKKNEMRKIFQAIGVNYIVLDGWITTTDAFLSVKYQVFDRNYFQESIRYRIECIYSILRFKNPVKVYSVDVLTFLIFVNTIQWYSLSALCLHKARFSIFPNELQLRVKSRLDSTTVNLLSYR